MASSGLFQCEDPETWLRASDVYWDVVSLKGAKQKKLLQLDKWYQEELPSLISARPQRFLSRDELIKLMEWKLTRGKFRPRLQQLVSSNPAEIVKSCSSQAFRLLPDVSAALDELCQLKGIGPATASAVLAAGAPDLTAFMADEAVESVPGLTPVQYTSKHYLRYLDALRQKAATLSKASGETWNPHRLELCLWAWKVAQKLCPERLDPVEKENDDDEERQVKKQKRK